MISSRQFFTVSLSIVSSLLWSAEQAEQPKLDVLDLCLQASASTAPQNADYRKAKKVFTVGGATMDTFLQYKNPATIQIHTCDGVDSFLVLREGGKVDVSSILHATGGGATNVAVGFKRLGFSVATFFKLGFDQAARDVLSELQHEGIDVESVVFSSLETTGQSFIIPSLSGDRTVFACRGANTCLLEREVPYERFANLDCLYVSSLSGASGQLLLPLMKAAKKGGALIALNPGGSQLRNDVGRMSQALAYTDILIVNSEEAKIFMKALIGVDDHVRALAAQPESNGDASAPELMRAPHDLQTVCFSLKAFFATLHEKGPRVIVVTNGAEGVYVSARGTIYFHPSLPVEVVNTLGAGDAFGSTFVGSILAGVSIEKAIRFALLNSASVIHFLDAKTGLLPLSTLQERERDIDQQKLKAFPLA